MSVDYDALDEAIVAELEARKLGFNALLHSRGVWTEAKSLSDCSPPGKHGARKEPMRFVDSRLQALRRSGKIRYTGLVWETT